MIVDLSEKQYVNFLKTEKKESNIIVIDNGTYELKCGYINDLCMIIRNRIYKYKDKVSFEPFSLASVKTIFENDVILNFDILECIIDLILEHLNPSKLDSLIITNTPNSPTTIELIDMLFSVYKFEKIQIGYDFIYSYNRYFKGEECLIIALKYSSIIVAYVGGNKIKEIYKINFGCKDMINYINFVMVDKYKNFRKDYKNLMNYIRLSDDYIKETGEIYNELCNCNYSRNLFLSEPKIQKIEKINKKQKKNTRNNIGIPNINYSLIETDDNQLDLMQIKEKRKHKMAYYGALYRLKTRNEKYLERMRDIIENMEDELERKDNIESYTNKKKKKFDKLKRELELRDKLRQDLKNKKSKEFLIKNKEGVLTNEEQELKNRILDLEDEEQDAELIKKIDELAFDIIKLDPEFIPFYANTVEILRGDNIGRECVNIELIKWPEIIFDPSIIGSEEMGLKEIIENIALKYSIKNALICGGLSYIPNLYNRIKSILDLVSETPDIHIVHESSNPGESFQGADFLDFFPTLTRKEFEQYGAENLYKKYFN